MTEKPRWVVTRQTVGEVFAAGVPLHFINASTLNVWGQPVEIHGDYESFADAVLICAPVPLGGVPSGRSLAACDDCAHPIMHMTNAPKTLKRVCVLCAKRGGFLEPPGSGG